MNADTRITETEELNFVEQVVRRNPPKKKKEKTSSTKSKIFFSASTRCFK